MALVAFLTLWALPTLTHQLAVSSLQTTELAAEASADRTLAGATGLLESLESDVAHLWDTLRGSRTASLVQLTAESHPASAAKPASASKPAHHKDLDAATAVKEMDKLKPSQMPAMLGLLTGMYDSWKDKIGEANKKEHDQKTAYEKTIKDLEAKKAVNKDNKDAQATYDRIEKYWKRQRAISHRQYHTALKIMHSGMQKFKAVSGAMNHAIAGKKPSAQDLQTIGAAMPDVVFVQVQELVHWTQGASSDLKGARNLSA
jgi:hypothetical protein